MNPSQKQRALRKMLKQIRPEETLVEAASTLESAGLGDEETTLVTAGFKKLEEGTSLDLREEASLEAIIHKRDRPVVNVIGGTYNNPPAPWTFLGQTDIKERLQTAIKSIGRIELPGHVSIPFGGTGFVVGPDLLMTNRHVAELFANGVGQRQLVFRSGQAAAIDFKREILPSNPVLLTVTKVEMIHPFWDMALLKVDGLPAEHRMLTLSVEDPAALEQSDVVVVGYPAQDRRNDISLQNEIFGGIFDVKRLQPGKLQERRKLRSFGHEVNTVTHDCSTLGGNSGSAVVSINSGKVVALHFAGLYLDANFAVPTMELARDPRVVSAGVNFSGSVPSTEDWDSFWATADGHGGSESSAVGVDLGGCGSGKARFTIPLQVDVSFGKPTLSDCGPAQSVTVSARAPAPASPMDAEGRFGSSSQNDIDDVYRAVKLHTLNSDDFEWHTALAAAACSNLAYDVPAHVISTAENQFGFEQCEVFVNGSTQCFVASSADAHVVSFRGTDNTKNWFINLDLFSTDEPDYGAVHAGFYHAFHGLRQRIEQVIGDARTGARKLIITGHSLGGAMATIAAAEWEDEFNLGGVYTFGQPAVGKEEFQVFIKAKLRDMFFRFKNDKDIVTMVPPTYDHVGKLFHFDSGNDVSTESVASDVSSRGIAGVAAPATTEDEVMNEAEFRALQESMRINDETGAVASVSVESIGVESFFPNISDHSMVTYMQKVMAQL